MSPSSPQTRIARPVQVFVGLLFLFSIAVQLYDFWRTRAEAFPGVWIARTALAFLLAAYIFAGASLLLMSPVPYRQLPPFLSLQYLKSRWPMVVCAFVSLAAVPVYLVLTAELKDTAPPQPHRTLFLVFNQMCSNASMLLIFVILDVVGRMMQKKTDAENAAAASLRPASPRSAAQLEMGYFSPKSKGTPATTAPFSARKAPFEGGKFGYAR